MSIVLVTGGGGFIGREVAKQLLSRKYKVRLFDLVGTDIEEADGCHTTGSILDPYELSKAVRGCDYVIHLAAAVGVQRTEKNQLECLFINIQGTVNVLDACVRERAKKIVFASSSEVYGEPKSCPITEEAPLNPISNYAVSKIVGEQYLNAYAETYGIKYNIVRLFNVYGEYQKREFVIPNFVKNVLDDKPPRVYGKGKQVRSFCYVEDAARGIVSALFCPRAGGEIFNIGNDYEPISIKDLAQKVIKISRRPLKPSFVNYNNSDRVSERDILTRIPSIEKAKRILKFRPQVSLDDGLSRMISFYKSKGNEAV